MEITPMLLALGGLFLSLLVVIYIRASCRSRVTPSRHLGVLITGCDSGLGQKLALKLADSGYVVFAGCLTPTGGAQLKGKVGILPFFLDVTEESSIAKTVEFVNAWVEAFPENHLHALVNNAGIGESGLVDWSSMSVFRRTFEVNFFGAVALTKGLLPHLMAASSHCAATGLPCPRVVNISSVAGLIGVPGLSAYCASKFSLEAFSDSLRLEMAPWKLGVALIEPSFLKTPIIAGSQEKQWDTWNAVPKATRELWGEKYFKDSLVQSKRTLAGAESPELGVQAMFDAVTHTAPSARYKAGFPARTYLPILAALPAYLSDPILLGNIGRVVPAGMLGLKGGEGGGPVSAQAPSSPQQRRAGSKAPTAKTPTA